MISLRHDLMFFKSTSNVFLGKKYVYLKIKGTIFNLEYVNKTLKKGGVTFLMKRNFTYK